MSNLVLYKDSPQILSDFGDVLTDNLKLNVNARRSRIRYRSRFGSNPYIAQSIRSRRSTSKSYRATGSLSRSIEYKVIGMKLYISFNEYGVVLDRGSDGYVLRQIDNRSLLYDADINYDSYSSMKKRIEEWTKKRGIRLRKQDGLLSRPLKNSKSNRKKLNFLIQRSLLNRGQNATFWFTNPYKALSEKLPENLIFGMFKTMDNAFDSIFNKY